MLSKGTVYAVRQFWMPFNGDIGIHDATWAEFEEIYIKQTVPTDVSIVHNVARDIFVIRGQYPVICY